MPMASLSQISTCMNVHINIIIMAVSLERTNTGTDQTWVTHQEIAQFLVGHDFRIT